MINAVLLLGEPLEHNALLVEDALEPLLEGGVAPPLLDVLSDGGADRLRSGNAVNPRHRVKFGGLLGVLADGRGAGGLPWRASSLNGASIQHLHLSVGSIHCEAMNTSLHATVPALSSHCGVN